VSQFDLKAALKCIGWSQAELARRLGVDVMTVNRWANGVCPAHVVEYMRVLGLAHEMLRKP